MKWLPFLILLLIVSGCFCRPPGSSQSSTKPEARPSVSPTPTPANDVERLAKGKEVASRLTTSSSSEIGDAETYLGLIPKNSPQYKEAQKVLREIEKYKANVAKKLEADNAEIVKDKRQAVIRQLEQNLLKQGMDFYFSFEGKNETTLRVKYVLMSRPIVYNITKETEFLNNMRDLGVKKVIFEDGYDEYWTYNL